MGGVTLHVADAAVAAVATVAARAQPGVVTAWVTATPELVRVAVVTRMGDNCRDLAAAVQRALTHTLVEQTGRSAQVEVTVAEILPA